MKYCDNIILKKISGGFTKLDVERLKNKEKEENVASKIAGRTTAAKYSKKGAGTAQETVPSTSTPTKKKMKLGGKVPRAHKADKGEVPSGDPNQRCRRRGSVSISF